MPAPHRPWTNSHSHLNSISSASHQYLISISSASHQHPISISSASHQHPLPLSVSNHRLLIAPARHRSSSRHRPHASPPHRQLFPG
eukprot:5367312-Prymnesium_polylepis.1